MVVISQLLISGSVWNEDLIVTTKKRQVTIDPICDGIVTDIERE